MTLQQADEIAGWIRERLAPHCLPGKCVVAGSIRRRKLTGVKDVEIVCIPKTVDEFTLFGEPMPVRDPAFCAALDAIGKATVGDARGKYAQRMVAPEECPETGNDPVALDCFMACPANWGLILAIRTGSSEWAHRKLMGGFRMREITCSGGELRDRHGLLLDGSDERKVLEHAGIAWTEPEDRKWP